MLYRDTENNTHRARKYTAVLHLCTCMRDVGYAVAGYALQSMAKQIFAYNVV